MKKLFLKGIAYVGLYAEITSATCRWVSLGRKGRWKAFVEQALVHSGYLPPPELNDFVRQQPRNIQACLKINPRVLRHIQRLPNNDDYNAIHGH